MKKIYILTAVMAAAALASCTREPVSYDGISEFGPNTIAFKMEEAPGTKGGQVLSATNIKLDKELFGQTMILRETVTRLGGQEEVPATKGSPITDANVAEKYGEAGFKAGLADDRGRPLFGSNSVADFTYDSKHDKWTHTFASNPLDEFSPINFVMFMPDMMEFSIVDGLVRFKHLVPSDRNIRDQKDILVAMSTLTKEGYDPARGFSAKFYHPLVGIRFKLGNTANNTKLSSISLEGILDNGRCNFDPATGAMTWEEPDSPTYTTYSFTLRSHLEDGSINNEEGEYTFWLIPQMLTDDATLSLFVTTDGIGEKKKLSINLNEALGGGSPVEWKAGELHTFVLTPNFIEVHTTAADNNTVVITNVGNIPAYMRAAITDNWISGNKIVGAGSGSFEGLPGAGWTLKSDGYYYTTSPVEPGAEAPALYTKYTPGSIPTIAPANTTWSLDVAAQGVADNSVWQ